MAQQIKKKYLSDEVINYFDDQINTVETDLSSEISRATAAEGVLDGKIDQEILDRQNAVAGVQSEVDQVELDLASEVSRATNAENALDGRLDIIEPKVSTLESEMDAVELGLSNEISRATAAEAAIQGEVDALETYVDATFIPLTQKGAALGVATLDSNGKIIESQLPAIAITDVFVVADIAARDALTVEKGDVAKVTDAGAGLPKTYIYTGTLWVEIESGSDVDSVFGRTGAVTAQSGDYSASQISYGAGSNVEAKLDSLQGEIDAEEATRANADAALDGRITTLENALAPVWAAPFKKDLTATDISNGYIDLPHLIVPNSAIGSVDRLTIHETEDFTVSTVGGVTRITFTGELVAPGNQSLDANDNVFFKYQYLA